MAVNVERLLARFEAGIEAHRSHPPRLRLDWDGMHRCPACDPAPPRPMQVRQVMPGCWEVWCRRCAFLTNTGLVAQVGTWGRAMQRAGEHLAGVHGVAGRTLSAADPQLPAGAVVSDACGTRWVNSGRRLAWISLDHDGDPESWEKVAGNYGPVTVIRWGDER